MKDTIYRQAAIDEIEERKNANGYRNVAVISELNRLEGYIMRLPSAQPERKTGRWIEQDDAWDGVYYECSSCGEPWTLIDGTPWDNGMNFCPNCGARMEGEG